MLAYQSQLVEKSFKRNFYVQAQLGQILMGQALKLPFAVEMNASQEVNGHCTKIVFRKSCQKHDFLMNIPVMSAKKHRSVRATLIDENELDAIFVCSIVRMKVSSGVRREMFRER